MFEREIKFIYDFNLNKVNKLGPTFTYEQLSAVDLHPAILNYISAEIDYIIFEDRQKLLKDSLFDYSGEKISYYFTLINEEIKKTKRLSLDYISKLILHASSFNIHYLIRPKWTLTRFIFDEVEHKTSAEIKQILNYTYYYSYLKKILVSYINTKKILSLNIKEFEELLEKIEKAGLETNLKNILSTALTSMADFFNIGELQKYKIPLLAIETFLKEKNLDEYIKRLRIAFGEDSMAKCNIKDIQKEFNAVMMIEEEAIQDKEQIVLEEDEEVIEKEEVIDKFQLENIQDWNTKSEEINLNKYETKEKLVENESEESQHLKEEIKNEDEISISYKPQKFRIRVDKDNEIEPLDAVEENHNDRDNEDEVRITNINYQNIDSDLELKNISEQNELENNIKSETEENKLEVNDEIYDEESEEEKDTLETIIKNVKTVDEEEKVIIDKEPIEEQKENSQIDFDEKEERKIKSININKLLKDKEITKIIEVIFDYDIEDFSNVLDSISNCNTIAEANLVINKALANRNFSIKSKEAELFKSIISEYFKSS